MRVFLIGILMGFCDLIPGISGATIAYLLGIYPKIIQTLHNIDLHLIKNLFLFRTAEIKKRIDIIFVLSLLAGIILSLFSFCHIIKILLLNPYGYSCLIGLFFGLVGLISINQLNHLIKYSSTHLNFALSGFLSFYLLDFALQHVQIANLERGVILPIWIGGGIVSAIAGLLPGISGTFILFLLGLYTPLLEAMCFVPFGHLPSIFLVGNFAVGVLIGLLICGKILYHLLKSQEIKTKLFLTGFTLAAVCSLIKNFFSFHHVFLLLALIFIGIGILIGFIFIKWRYEPS